MPGAPGQISRPNWRRISESVFKPAPLAMGAHAKPMPNQTSKLATEKRETERKAKKFRINRWTPRRSSEREEQPDYAVANQPNMIK
jgi:hypothetical protein